MSSQENTTVLITGANRGIGRGLAEAFLSRPNHTVIGAVRDVTSKTTQDLRAFRPGPGSKLIVVKIENTSETDADQAVKEIQSAGISALDIVVANSGIAGSHAKVADIEIEDLRSMFEVNTYGPVRLLRAVFPLLKATVETKGPGSAKFLAISSNAASILNLEENVPFLLGSYGASKAAVNYLVRRAHFENPWLVAWVMDPGFAQTDMGAAGAQYFGLKEAFVPVKDSVEGLIKKIDTATREETSGNFFHYDGTAMEF